MTSKNKGSKKEPHKVKKILEIELLDSQKEHIDNEVISDEHVFVKKNLPEETTIIEEKEKTVEEFYSDKKLDKNEINKKLTEIYENDNGDMPDMQQFQKSTRNGFIRAFFVLIFSVIFFASMAWLGFFVIQPGVEFSEEDVILTISGTEDYIFGENNTYRIRYKNAQNVPLNNVVLEVRYPKGFVFVSSTLATKDDKHDSWDLGYLEGNGSGYIDVIGNIYGDLNSEQSFRVFLNYMPENFSSSFQKVANLKVENLDAIVNLDINLPEKIVEGLDTPIKVTISPNSDSVVKNIIVECVSDSFKLKSSEPKSEVDKDCYWLFEDFSATKEINLSGFFTKNDVDNKFTINVKSFADNASSTDEYIIASLEKEIVLSKVNTVFNLAINGTVNSFEMQPGENINASILIKNDGDTIFNDAKLKIILDAPAFNNKSILSWNNLEMGDNNADVVGQKISDEIRRGVIVFDKRYFANLQQIKPGDEIKIDFSLPIKGSEEVNLADYISSVIKVSGELSYNLNGKEEIISSNNLDIKLISDLKMSVEDEIAEDVEGNALYKVDWILTNSYHDLKNIEVSADIYGEVNIEESGFVVPAGKLVYDKEKKKLIWTIEQMPTSVDILAAHFDVSILKENPSQKNLTSKPVIKANDETLNQEIRVFGQEIILSK
ncbi:MAG: hypothetical protein WC070_03740 [Candidatus Magasanikbacteria bacterium]